MPRQQLITPDLVRQAGGIIDRALAKVNAKPVTPGLDLLAAARREPDPVTRVTKTVAALKQGSHDLLTARQRMGERQKQLPSVPNEYQITPEAQRELAVLKEHIMLRIRRRAEEELARAYPQHMTDSKRRRPPRGRMSV